MDKPLEYGVGRGHEISAADLYSDHRTPWQKRRAAMKANGVLATALVCLAIVCFMYPATQDAGVVMAFVMTAWGMRQERDYPLQAPIYDQLDGGPAKGPREGIGYLGQEKHTGRQIWLSNDEMRQHMLVLGTTGAGKSLDEDAPVHTPTGWRRLGDLKVGDLVSTPDGRSAPITGYYPQGELDICRITFEDGRTADPCPNHLWEVHHKHWNGKYAPGVSRAGAAKPRLLTTRQIAELLETNKGDFYIRLPQPVEKPVASLALDPYLLGAMLGDGNFTRKTIRFSSVDTEILDRVGAALPSGMELHRYDYNADADWNVRFRDGCREATSPVRDALTDMGLFGLDSSLKFIPDAYKEASVAQRWALVQGLMDTDGTCDARKVALSFSTGSERLARDFQDVVRSLGGIAKIGDPEFKTYVHDGERRVGNASWRVSIRHPDPTSFFSLPRKVALADRPYQHADRLKLRISKVEMGVRRAQAACIMVDHPDHLFITRDYVVTHNTETLVSFVANALSWSSGFLYCDGKGDVAVFAKLYALTRRFGRDDDFLVINFMSADKDAAASTEGGIAASKISNTTNPFSSGSAADLTQLVVGLMDGGGGGNDGMWRGRAQAMFTGVMRALAWLRDEGRIDMGVGAIRDHLEFQKIYDLAYSEDFATMPAPVKKSVRAYLMSLPGFQEALKEKQGNTTLDQHGFLQMQFTKIMGSLVDDYGYIFAQKTGEVDFQDVVLNRRVLVIMLPALQKSSDEIANIGKIIVGNLKGMMATQLGSVLQGTVDRRVDARATNSDSPFIVVLDEAGYYTVDGMALMTAQARSLGFCIIISSQDIPAMLKLSDTEAKSVIGNTNTKVFMRIEDMDSTMDLVVKSGGKGWVTRVGSFDRDTTAGSNTLRKGDTANFHEVDRINPLQVKGQKAGQFVIVHQQHVIFGNSFYANPAKCYKKFSQLQLRVNHFIPISRYEVGEVDRQESTLNLVELFMSDEEGARMLALSDAQRNALGDRDRARDEIGTFARSFHQSMEANRAAGETHAACAAMADVARIAAGYPSVLDQQAPSGTPSSFDAIRDSGRSDRYVDPDQQGTAPGTGFGSPSFEEEHDDRPFAGSDPEDTDAASEIPHWAPPEDGVPGFDTKPTGENRRPAKVDLDIRHEVHVGGVKLEDVSQKFTDNDVVLRALEALNFDPEKTTTQEVDSDLQEALGAKDDPDYSDVAESEAIDEVVIRTERLRASSTHPTEEKSSEEGEASSSSASGEVADVYLAELWDTIMEEGN